MVKILNDYVPPLLFSLVSLYRKRKEKFIRECKKKWADKHKSYEDKIFKDLIKPETIKTRKPARRKHVS